MNDSIEILHELYTNSVYPILNDPDLLTLKNINVNEQKNIKLYYESIFMEMIILNLWKYIHNFNYENNEVVFDNNIILRFYLDNSDNLLYKIILFCPVDTQIFHTYEVLPIDQLIIEKFQNTINKLHYYYESKEINNV